MHKCADALLVTLFSLGACSPEVTAPEGGAAIGKVVPVAVPDTWCSAVSDAGDTTATKRKNLPRPTCRAPAQPASGRDSLTFAADSLVSP